MTPTRMAPIPSKRKRTPSTPHVSSLSSSSSSSSTSSPVSSTRRRTSRARPHHKTHDGNGTKSDQARAVQVMASTKTNNQTDDESHVESTAVATLFENTTEAEAAAAVVVGPRPPHALLTSSERRTLGLSGLVWSAISGDLTAFEKEVQRVGALPRPEKNWSRVDLLGRCVLHGAAAAGHPIILQQALVAKMVHVDTQADGGVTALFYALDRKDVDGAARLLVAGADPGLVERTYGLWRDAAWATETMGFFGTPRAEALALLKDALHQALAERDAQRLPWLDLATQQDLFHQWAAGLTAGTRVDACDCDEHWYEAEVMRTFPGGVRVSYLSWGPRFEEDIDLDSLRVLPAYSVVPAWRETLTIGSPVEILATTVEAPANPTPPSIPPSDIPKPERKWWDATCRDIDRLHRKVLLTVDGRAHLSRWVDVRSREIADIGTHVKHAVQVLLPPPLHHHLVAAPSMVGKESVSVTMRQAAGRAAAKAKDLNQLLSHISMQRNDRLTLLYIRRKLGLVAFYHSQAETAREGMECALLSARRTMGRPDVQVQPKVLTNGTSYAETRQAVLAHVVTDLQEDLFVDLLYEYMG